jgi:ABC-type antimicrobial peptide transport system permease subunit
MARTYFGEPASTVGRTFRFDNGMPSTQVVGVIQNVRHRDPRGETPPYIYYPHAQNPSDFIALTIRTSVPPASLTEPVRRAIAEVDSSLNVQSIATLEQQFDSMIRTELLLARLTAAFGLLALALTCVGLYGLLAYSVARRTNEIGLRMALGAQQGAVVRGVLRQTLGLVAVGVAAGLAIALAVSRLVESQLYEVAPHDPVTIATAVGIVFVVALLAAGRPARRAARIEPMQALRYE